jgi:hypothetical protein
MQFPLSTPNLMISKKLSGCILTSHLVGARVVISHEVFLDLGVV